MSDTIDRALVIGATSGVGAATAAALAGAGTAVIGSGSDRDATDPDQVAELLAEADPDLVVIAAGVRPKMADLDEQSWESFSAAWDVDVKIAFEVGRAAIERPLRPGSTVLVVSSGAAVVGSPRSGGYAGAKRMQMFMAGYFQKLADERGLGIRFVAIVPQQLLAGTPIGEAAAAAYAAAGESVDEYMSRFPHQLDPQGVAAAIVEVARGEGPDETVVGLTGAGLKALGS